MNSLIRRVFFYFFYLTIVPRAWVGGGAGNSSASLAIMISFSTGVSGIIVLLKTSKKYC